MDTGIIFDIKKFAVHDGPGIRTTIFFKGCPAQCQWCHNPESQNGNPEPFMRQHHINGNQFTDQEEAGYSISVPQLMNEILRDRVFFEQSGGGVTFSGGEPFTQPEFLHRLLQRCRLEGIHTAIDTAGYVQESIFRKISPLVDLFLYDIKIIDEKLHQLYTGVSNQLIHKNLNYLIASGKRIRMRIPVIPGITDTQENLKALKSYLSKIADKTERIDLLAFHKIAREKYHRFGREFKLQTLEEPNEQHMKKIQKFFSDLSPVISLGG